MAKFRHNYITTDYIKCNRTKEVFNPQTWLFNVVKKDSSLRFPLRKILEYLTQQYDYEEKTFKEVNFNKIVKDYRLGKNKAKEYLEYLEQNGLVKRRYDGYRAWYKIKYEQ